MHKEQPPRAARQPGKRVNKFQDIIDGLLEEPGEWFNITADVNKLIPRDESGVQQEKKPAYYIELARSISLGARAGFEPRGSFLARAKDSQIWATAVPEEDRAAAIAEAEAEARAAGALNGQTAPSGEDDDADITVDGRQAEPAF